MIQGVRVGSGEEQPRRGHRLVVRLYPRILLLATASHLNGGSAGRKQIKKEIKTVKAGYTMENAFNSRIGLCWFFLEDFHGVTDLDFQ